MVTTSQSGNGTHRRLVALLGLLLPVLILVGAWALRMEGQISDLRRFQGAGPRFTQPQGDVLDRRIDALESSVAVLDAWMNSQEIPPPEVQQALDEIRRRLDALERTRRS